MYSASLTHFFTEEQMDATSSHFIWMHFALLDAKPQKPKPQLVSVMTYES